MDTKKATGLCERCRAISPHVITQQQPYKLKSGVEAVRVGYDHGTLENLEISAAICRMCNMMLAELMSGPKVQKVKDGKEHRVILDSDAYIESPTAPRRLAGMSVGVTNSNLKAYFHVFADSGISSSNLSMI